MATSQQKPWVALEDGAPVASQTQLIWFALIVINTLLTRIQTLDSTGPIYMKEIFGERKKYSGLVS